MWQQFQLRATESLIGLSESEYFLLLLTLFSLSLIGLWRFYVNLRRAGRISAIPTSKIRSASQGEIELNGITGLMAGPPIVSPVSGRQCVWFQYVIEQKEHYFSGKQRRQRWRVIKSYTSDALFLLKDKTGECIVDPEGAQVIKPQTRRWRDKLNHNRRYRENFISEAQHLYAIGWFHTVSSVTQHHQREQVSLLLREWKQNFALLLEQFDINKDGKLSSAEWQKAVELANQQVRDKHLQQSADALNILSAEPARKKTLILSTIPEASLIHNLRWRTLGGLCLFLLGGSLAVWAINIR